MKAFILFLFVFSIPAYAAKDCSKQKAALNQANVELEQALAKDKQASAKLKQASDKGYQAMSNYEFCKDKHVYF